MHPAIFITLSTVLGFLFAVQEWVHLHAWGMRTPFSVLVEAWCMQYFIWGVLCWLLWRGLGDRIQQAGLFWMVGWMLPLSILTSVLEEMIWVAFFPHLPINRPNLGYWARLSVELNGELFENILTFWCAVGLFRGIGYYQKYREKEDAAMRLETQLANARIEALRMQLNPHFLFNAMNSISSLMRTDIEAADTMLEQLSSLLRITLERGDVQLIPLREEMEFIELYLAMQDRRSDGRVRQTITVEPELHDALVPAMILQPIVENAYAHGLSQLTGEGILAIAASREMDRMTLTVENSGIGLGKAGRTRPPRRRVGIANIKSRLQLHYGDRHSLTIQEVNPRTVLVTITIPLEIDKPKVQPFARFGT
jgi:two-component sensor histidine kinase